MFWVRSVFFARPVAIHPRVKPKDMLCPHWLQDAVGSHIRGAG